MEANVIGSEQLEMMLQMVDDYAALERRWVHKLGHVAASSGYTQTGERLHEVMAAFDEARSMLDDARGSLEREAGVAQQ